MLGSVLPTEGGICRRFKAMPVRDEAREQARVVDHLREQFPQLKAETVEAAVALAWNQYADAPVRDFVPVLVARDTHVALASRDAIDDIAGATVACAW